jgi:hypothetical protein
MEVSFGVFRMWLLVIHELAIPVSGRLTTSSSTVNHVAHFMVTLQEMNLNNPFSICPPERNPSFPINLKD